MYPRGQSSYYRHKTKIVIGGGPAPQSHYDAGEVWPKKIPLEGSPRLAIAVPYVLDNVGRGLRPRSGFTLGTLRHQFTKDKPPVIQVSGYKATDIVVSSSLYNVFFTLESNGNSTPGIYDISIEDGGVTINLKSNDPGTSLTVSADPQVGLASLHVSSIVAADSIFAAASSLPARADFMAAFTPLSALNDKMLEPVLDRLRALSDPERARILREVLPIVDVMFRKTSRFAGRDDSFWDYDATLFDTEDRGGLQSPAAERDWNDVGYFERADTYTDMLSAWDDMAEMETTPLGARWLMRAIGCLEMLSVIPCEDTTT
jgi:hypothetical protein